MENIKLFIILSLIGFVFNLYIAYEHFKKRRTSQNKHQAEINLYFDIMRCWGYKNYEIAEMLFDIKNFDDLKQHNEKSLPYVKDILKKNHHV